jgi:uncharacterized protein YPO0396
MKLLSRMGLLQFFLYERADLDIDRNTAFLGPNGTGKTCLLDAIQTVMLGADATRVHYNAQADGHRRDRSLRSYCLGVYDQTERGRCRDVATTYISLVFRDENTGAVVTAGVGLSARADTAEHTFHGLFILPGVDLTTADLIELRDGQERILPWKDAQYRFRALIEQAGGIGTAVITQNREEFVRKLLIDNLAAPGDKPNPSMFRNAFQRSLQLKVMNDLSTALRDNLIESHPTQIRDFKARADQFRHVRNLVLRVKEQIEAIAAVRQSYERIRTLHVREVNYKSLAATLEVEAHSAHCSTLEDQLADLTDALNQAKAQLERLGTLWSDAQQAFLNAREARSQEPSHDARIASTLLLEEREKGLTQATEKLEIELRNLLAGVTSAVKQPALTDDQAILEDTVIHLNEALQRLDKGTLPDAEHMAILTVALQHTAQAVQAQRQQAEDEHRELKRKLEAIQRSQERMKAGLAQLAPPVEKLQSMLAEHGIEATPVCDLVEVRDPEWQAVIEAFLGLNTQALLVPQHQEEEAIRLYRTKKDAGIYGAKLAAPSRIRPWRSTAPGRLAANLIHGTNALAVDYVQSELGQIECVRTERELLNARRAFTSDGMIATGSGIERRRLHTDLVIGRQDRAASQQQAAQALRDLLQQFGSSETTLRTLIALSGQFSGYEAGSYARTRLVEAVEAMEQSRRNVKDAREQQEALSNDTLLALDERVRVTGEARDRIGRERETSQGKAHGIEARIETATKELDTTHLAAQQARDAEQALRSNLLYDAREVGRLRDKLDEDDADSSAKSPIEVCRHRSESAGKQANQLEVQAGEQLSQYRVAFNVNADIPRDWPSRTTFAIEEHTRLQTLTLAEKEAEAEAALRAAEKIFRTDVVQSLLTGFDRIKEQITALNNVLDKAPEFSNRERYIFKHREVDQYRQLHDFILRVRANDNEGSLWTSDDVPTEFRELMESDASSPLLLETSPLYDYRRFYAFDIEIRRDGQTIGVLSKRFGPGSGGEHRTPLYVIFGAALAAAYGNVHGKNAGGGLMLLDEAFDKMDANNVLAVANYLNDLGLQLLMAGPETDQPKLSGFLDMYYDMARHGTTSIHMEPYVISNAARQLLASDNPIYHPDLIAQEIRRMRGFDDDDRTGRNLSDDDPTGASA